MKPFLMLAISFLLVSSALGQEQGLRQTDSLKHQLSITRQDTSRVLIMAELSEAYRGSNPDSAMLYGQQALILARKTKFLRGEVHALLSMSVDQRELGNLPYALEVALRALKIAQENHYEDEVAVCLVRVGNVYSAINNYPTAIRYLRRGEKKLYGRHEARLAVTRMLIGDAYEQMNKLDSALYYEKLAYQKMFQVNHEALIQGVFRVLGNIEAKLKNNQLALTYYKQGIKAAFLRKDYRSASAIYTSIASLYKNQNQPDSAIYYAKQGLAYAQKLSYKNRIMAASSLLAELYEPKDTKEALRYYKLASAANDSLYSAQKVHALQALTFGEQERQREIEAAKIAYRNEIRQYALLATLGVFVIIALILYRNMRLKQKANALLKHQKNEIDTQKDKLQLALDNLKATQVQLIQREKMASLGELTAGIAHEIQNPLNFINNFSEVNVELIAEMEQEIIKRDIKEVRTLAKDLRENNEKINFHGKRAEYIVKGMLQHSRTSTGERQLTDINLLAEEFLKLSYYSIRTKDKVFHADMVSHFDEGMPKILVIPQEIGRVLLNIFNNAIYATQQKKVQLNGQYQPEVRVSTRCFDGKVEITVRDNGCGIPDTVKVKIFQPFFTTKPTGQGTGLGLSLSYDIITKGHGGDLKVNTQEGEYSEFIIILPLKEFIYESDKDMPIVAS